ncbi:MAG TPA: proteasome subunit alpha, partial [Acidimicrobiia bacterium]|nr:proteasome subunit alpha [Acidimicrobiia bacterium]
LAENPSTALHKISEVYDRIAFAGVGKYNEFETLRKAGIRQADLMGYLYSRDDVNAQALATNFSEALGAIFSREPKPFEVEVLVAEVGEPNRMYRISYDGTLNDERRVAAIGGKAEALVEALRQQWTEGMTLEAALEIGKSAFRTAEGRDPEGWEAAVLDRRNGRRAFRRLTSAEVG